MWTRSCAHRRKAIQPAFHRRLIPSAFLGWIISCLFCCSLLLFPPGVHADETIITAVILNQEPAGEYFVILRDDGDFLIRPEDLAEMGFQQRPTKLLPVDGVNYVLLGAMDGVDFSFDENTLSLKITAAPELLPKNTMDLSIFRRGNVYYPHENSFFINYGIDYATAGDSLDFQNLSISNELGLRIKEVLLLSDSIYVDTADDSRLIRLNTRLIVDNRDTLQRYVAGDLTASSGFLGSTVNMGGVSISKLYRLDPYFINYPLFDFTGQVALPSDVELYVDGVKKHSQRFAPGEFELLNYQGILGAQNVEVVIRDSFGRQQTITSSIYATDEVLRRGLHEYSYNLGFLRQDFGIESNNYDELAFSAFHRYGVTDQFNLVGRGELNHKLTNLGLETMLVSRNFGLLRVEGSASTSGNETGAAGLISYEYQTPRFSSRMSLQRFSSAYRTLADYDTSFDRKLNFLAKTSYVTVKRGVFSLGYAYSERFTAASRQVITAGWSHRIYQGLYMRATLSHVDGTDSGLVGSISFTWNFDRDRALTADYRHDKEGDVYLVEARQNTPYGEGTGWSLQLEHAAKDSAESNRGYGFVQHNGRHAIVRGDLGIDRTESKTNEFMRLSLAGALTYVGKTFALTRPLRDSFSLVTIGDIEDVRIYVNGQNAGRTNHQGQVVIPDLNSYYENQISFEAKDIPLDYLMPNIRLAVSTPLKSGSCLNFPIKKYQAFTGVLLLEMAQGLKPLANAELKIKTADKEIAFWTSREGEFYLDNQQTELDINSVQGCDIERPGLATFLPPGIYPVVVQQAELSFDTVITIPSSEETFVEMGEIILKRVKRKDSN